MKEGCGRCPVLPPENGRAQSSGSVGEHVGTPPLHLRTKQALFLSLLKSQAWVDREAPPFVLFFSEFERGLIFTKHLLRVKTFHHHYKTPHFTDKETVTQRS